MEALNDYSGAVILISHDRHLLEASADRLWLVADGTVTPFEDDLDDYRKLVLDGAPAGKRPRNDSRNGAQDRRKAGADKRAQSAPLRKKIKETELLIAKLQKELEASTGSSAIRALWRPGKGGVPRQGPRRHGASIAAAEERWLTLSADHEQAVAEAG